MIITSMVMVAIISGCTINADTSVDITYPTLGVQVKEIETEPYIIEIEEEIEDLEDPWVEHTDTVPSGSKGPSWLYGKASEGVRGKKITKYAVAYNRDGEMLSRVEIPEEQEIIATTPTIYAGGQTAKPGNYYTSSRVTRYGYDCVGCNASNNRSGTASGIGVGDNEVRQYDGTWKKGITYEGYYIIATSQSIPLCTIVEISNHTISGRGISPGVPFKAIVLDRGGAITQSKTDLFVGSEKDPTVKMGRKKTFDVKIIDLNSRNRNNGTWNCSI